MAFGYDCLNPFVFFLIFLYRGSTVDYENKIEKQVT